MGGLSQLCEQFHFGELSEVLSQLRESHDLKEDVTQIDFEARKRLSALEERMQQRECEIVALRTERM
jgi:short-subunit dehydrogenase